MHDPSSDDLPLDVLGQFTEAEADDPIPGRRGILLTSVGFFLTAVLGAFGFVGGALWGAAHEPDLDYGNLAAEIGIKIGYAALWGALVAVALVALVVVGVGAFWIRAHLVARSRVERSKSAAAGTGPSSKPATSAKPVKPSKPRHH